MKIALLPGHSQTREGAEMCCGHFKGYGEWKLATWYLPKIADGLRSLGYDVVLTQRSDAGGSTPSFSAIAANATKADLALEFHFNSASPKASGSTVMFWGKSNPGKLFASLLAKDIARLLGLSTLGDGTLSVPTPDNRGTEAFRKSRMPFFMIEPCFAGSNDTDCQLFSHSLLSGSWMENMPSFIHNAIRQVYSPTN